LRLSCAFMAKELISVDQAASIKGVSTSTIYAWIGRRDNPLRSLRVDAYTLIERADLERFAFPKRGRKEKALTAKSIVRGLHNS
jgi:predicted DNA-binding transcriptional regulator AlpA